MEETIVLTVDLPDGTLWVWMGDANTVLLSSSLCEVGRANALDDLQAVWRRRCLHVIEGGAETAAQAS